MKNIVTKYYNEFILIFGVTIATCVITGIGFMLLFIPGIILGLGFSLCFYFIAEEKKMTIQECLWNQEMLNLHHLQL